MYEYRNWETEHYYSFGAWPPAAGWQLFSSLYLVGKPEPSLSWWRGSQLLDDSYEILNGQSVNTVRLEKLGRNDQDVQLSCRCSTVLY
jgi:hypothetical protein